MQDLTEKQDDAVALRLPRRTLLGALATLTAVSTLAVEGWAAPMASSGFGATPIPPVPRQLHTAVTLGSDLMLVAGGIYQGILADSQIFDPKTGLWYSAAPMTTPRAQHAAVALGGGRVLVLGGFYQGALADAEIYDQASDTWTAAPPMAFPRYDHSAALLGDGTVLIYGGVYQGVLDAPEIYNPFRTGNG